MHLVVHLYFFQPHRTTQKNCQRACKANAPKHRKQWTDEQRQRIHHPITPLPKKLPAHCLNDPYIY